MAWKGLAPLPAAAVAAAAAAADVSRDRGARTWRRLNAPCRSSPHGHGAGAVAFCFPSPDPPESGSRAVNIVPLTVQALMHLASDAVRAAAESPFLETAIGRASAVLCCLSLPPTPHDGAPDADYTRALPVLAMSDGACFLSARTALGS